VDPYKTRSRLHAESTIISSIVEKYTVTCSHTLKLVPKYGKDWVKNVAFRREILKIAQKHGNSVAAHVHKVLLCIDTNQLGLENYLSYPFTTFGGNGEKLRALALTKVNISLHRKSAVTHVHCINLLWL